MKSKFLAKEARLGIFMISPAMLIIIGLMLYPLIYTLYLTVADYNVLTGEIMVLPELKNMSEC